MNRVTSTDVLYILFKKGKETYAFSWDQERKSEILLTFGRFASNPELSFSWYDAAVLSNKVRLET